MVSLKVTTRKSRREFTARQINMDVKVKSATDLEAHGETTRTISTEP